MLGNRSIRSSYGLLRRGVACLCLAATLAFAGLDAVHQHHAAQPNGALAYPCRVCQLATTLHTPVAAPEPALDQTNRWQRLIEAPLQAPIAATVPLPSIRPPPAGSC